MQNVLELKISFIIMIGMYMCTCTQIPDWWRVHVPYGSASDFVKSGLSFYFYIDAIV